MSSIVYKYLLFYKDIFLKIMFKISMSIKALARNGSFDFAEELASCVGAKGNVPNVCWH